MTEKTPWIFEHPVSVYCFSIDNILNIFFIERTCSIFYLAYLNYLIIVYFFYME